MANMLKKRDYGNIVFELFNRSMFILITFLCVYPFYYLIINSLSANNLSAAGDIIFYPKDVHLSNYIEVFKMPELPLASLISVARTFLGTICTTIASAFLGFLFTKEKMWHRKFWYRFVIVTMYFNAGLIPVFMNVHNLHLTNNFLVYILPAIVSPFNIILVKTYIDSTPLSLQEAAMIDGAGIFMIFVKVIFPIITPILATIAIFSAVGQWNSFQDTLLYITNPKLYTLQYILYRYINQANMLANILKDQQAGDIAADLMRQLNPISVNMTVSVVITLPVLFVYPFFQRYIIKGVMIGAIKG